MKIRQIVLALTLLAVAVGSAATTIEMTVNGLVCAFCAQGIEKKLRKICEFNGQPFAVPTGTLRDAIISKHQGPLFGFAQSSNGDRRKRRHSERFRSLQATVPSDQNCEIASNSDPTPEVA